MLKCKHQCHCACSSEIGTCIINDAARQTAHKNNENSRFFGRISSNDVLYTCFEGTVYVNFQRQKKRDKKLPNLQALSL
jgi:hypothetical protein